MSFTFLLGTSLCIALYCSIPSVRASESTRSGLQRSDLPELPDSAVMAAEVPSALSPDIQRELAGETKTRVVYPKKTELDLDATQIEGELKNPGEFYFQVKPEDKMDSLVKRRRNFHRQMLRDVVFSK